MITAADAALLNEAIFERGITVTAPKMQKANLIGAITE